jgi:hypothetical protein
MERIIKVIEKLIRTEVKSLENLKKLNETSYFFFKIFEKKEILDLAFVFKKEISLILKSNIKKNILSSDKCLNLNYEDIEIIYSFFLIKAFLNDK